ncbi:DUF551 domain-containing protein [Bacteroides ovatus]|uniref:DUF551 domain-containing protein n=1 Tax=Bacteroides ovatus TaxID=28116 RepID=UPI00189A0D5F|nr:DUF551 domain-containing protein [Bacteroides ovatus]MDC2620608.1 DUF551 domain-containing protein [Bacteroides ovatus]MDC2747255.1 DUF551 domain-containing protein [Bacteroides ovatus]MDC2756900.1 DUF551 domain-containing protein [Bacteroides ovatus]
MILKDIISLLANRINQPRVIECYLRKVYAKGYEAGTKQSPWISVEERLPDYLEKVLVLYEYKGEIQIQQNSYLGEKDWKFGSNKILAWLPIPSFDEILEANRDVLERIQEKGD